MNFKKPPPEWRAWMDSLQDLAAAADKAWGDVVESSQEILNG